MSELKPGDLAMLVRGWCRECGHSSAMGIPFVVQSVSLCKSVRCCRCLRIENNVLLVEHTFDLHGHYFPRPLVIKIEPLSDPEAEETDLTEKV